MLLLCRPVRRQSDSTVQIFYQIRLISERHLIKHLTVGLVIKAGMWKRKMEAEAVEAVLVLWKRKQ